MSSTGNKFLMSLEATAREAGMPSPVVRAYPDWMLFDEQRLGDAIVLVPVGAFESAIDIVNRISDVAHAYVSKPLAEVK